MKITLATHNLHKREELSSLVGNILEIELLPDDFPEIPETGTTLEENAKIKARAVYEKIGHPTIADDTGLEVEALHGAPGVYTARYAGEKATYEDNCLKLLHELGEEKNRRAEFITVICFINEQGREFLFRGNVSGKITEAPRGTKGFGYDPVFEPIESGGKTFAEMNSDEKNELSHRGRAMAKFLSFIKNGTE
jgi:XTP/dITP diphosphohydrolase